MKTRSFFLAALLIAGATSAFAVAEPTASLAVVSAKGSEVVKVIYKGTTGKVKLNVYNNAGQVVFTETRQVQQGFIRPLNFTGLQAGEYTVELIDALGVQSEKITYQPVASVKTMAVHVAKLPQTGKFLLSVATGKDNNNGNVTIRIYDVNYNLIHTSKRQATGDFAQVFNIQNVEGAYTFEVATARETTSVRI